MKENRNDNIRTSTRVKAAAVPASNIPRPSAAVAYPLRGLMRCVFREAILHTTVVMRGYLRYCHLPVSVDQSGPSLLFWPLWLTRRFCRRTAAHWMCLVFWMCIFRDTQTTLSGTNNHSMLKVTLITFLPHSDIWSENSWTSWPRLHPFMHLVAASWLAD